MRKYAFIKDNVVRLVDSIDEQDYSLHIREWDSIIDVEDLSPVPQVGWMLIGNSLLPVSPETQQREQQVFGALLALEMVNKMGARNLALSQSGTSVNVSTILTNLAAVKALTETGALKTARSALQMYAPAMPLHADILAEAVQRITSFLQSKGWD
jgi:hypothetical protein